MRPLVQKTFSHPLYFLAMGLGSGLSPRAPGTAGSVAAIPIYLLLSWFPFANWVLLGVILVSLIAGIYLCDWVAKDMSVKDPGSIVWDEFVGMWIALLWLPEGWYWLIIAFALFRFFDVLKPFPVSWCDQKLSGGLGIMMDDVAAGLYSLLILQVLAYLKTLWFPAL